MKRSLGIVLALILSIAGCGYAPVAYEGQKVAGQVRSLHVPVFLNRTTRRNVEFLLTETVQRELLIRTPYRLVDKPTSGLILRGEIRNYTEPVLVEGSRDEIITQEVEIEFRMKLYERKKNGSETLLKQYPAIIHRGSVSPEIGETEETGRAVAFNKIAESVARALEKPWTTN